jgi:preprotein translocase subunit SecA
VDDILTRAFGSLERPTVDNPYAADYVRGQAHRKYGADLSLEHIRTVGLRNLRDELVGLQEKFLMNGALEQEIGAMIEANGEDEEKLSKAFAARFGAELTQDDINRKTSIAEQKFALGGEAPETIRQKMLRRGRQIIRQELTDLEQLVLIEILDQAWKDHLYAMDLLRGGVGLAGFAEKDPRIVYKKEGYIFFEQMMSGIRDKVTDLIFKVKLEGPAQARSQYRETAAVHEDTGGYGVAENLAVTAGAEKGRTFDDNSAAAAGAGEQKVATIVRDAPKVGRNDPCPCGSGKKYKKCHGADVV